MERHCIVVGGGAAGFFGAIAAAEGDAGLRVILLEATAHVLAKVRVSGGGRCNVTHACFDPRDLAARYPRGGRELMGAFTRWQPRDTIEWFRSRGVELKTEDDGRMFPVTDDSGTIVNCLESTAARAGVQVRLRSRVKSIERVSPAEEGSRFRLLLEDGTVLTADSILLATGGGRTGMELARALGHSIEPPVPSLFTFHVSDRRIAGLAGLAVANAEVAAPGTRLRERGPVLITHSGFSGPAILRLSAWGARILHETGYHFSLRINWTGRANPEVVRAELTETKAAHARRLVRTTPLAGVPLRLWERLVDAGGIPADATWASASSGSIRDLSGELASGEFTVTGKSLFKEEFVTCGGVSLREVDFRRMESRLVPRLHFAGEVLDIDGITGGFNFQAAWTTGRLAGRAIAAGHES